MPQAWLPRTATLDAKPWTQEAYQTHVLQPGHVDAESSCDYDNQQQYAEIDIATIIGGEVLGMLLACAHLQPLKCLRAAP